MKRRIVSLVLVLCLCMALLPQAQAEGVPETYTKVPSAEEVYQTLIKFKEKEGYTEGTAWTDADHSYMLKVLLDGEKTEGTGCAAFAFELSDAAFGDLPARKVTSFAFSDIKVGDILRVEKGTHSVIVLQVGQDGVVVAEGNYNRTVHWERAISKDTIETECALVITRYPEGYNPELRPNDPIAPGAEGELDGGLTWKVTNSGVLSISGTGKMPESFTFASNGGNPLSDRPWNDYISRILSVVIGNGVTSVSANAFRECKSIVSVSIPESVTSIGDNAFRDCTALKSITLPASVTSMGAGVFFECTELTKAMFRPSNSIVVLGNNLFSECWRLKSVILPQKVKCIGEGMFINCGALTSVTIPESAESIGASAFSSCRQLTQLWIPDTVTTIGIAAFADCGLAEIYFGGTKEQWDAIEKIGDTNAAVSEMTIHCNAEKPETPDIPDSPVIPDIPDTPSTPDPETHTHSWSSAWSSDGSYHWHECSAADCTVSANSGKNGYAAHVYGDWITDQTASAYQDGSRYRTCTVCGCTQTETIPAAGGSGWNTPYIPPSTIPSPPSSSTTQTPGNSDSSSGAGEPEDGAVPDNTVTETGADGTVTETSVNPDGSRTIRAERTDGTIAITAIDAAGRMEAEVTLSAAAAGASRESGEPVFLPIPEIQTVRDPEAAPVITVYTGSVEPVQVEIPAAGVTPGTVVTLVLAGGAETVIKTSVPTASGMTAALPDGASVKIVDNSKEFADISAGYWAEDAIDFVSAREIFGGTSDIDFSPDAPMTRAMLMVALARLDGADTSGGEPWYGRGLEWAIANGISDGSGLEDSITREQLVTMLWRYADCPAAAGVALSSFPDAGESSGYAQEALCWALESGILGGFGNGQLGPQGQATRAQVAQMLMNFIQM